MRIILKYIGVENKFKRKETQYNGNLHSMACAI